LSTENELQRALDHYDLGNQRIVWRVERGFVNENWVVETDRGRYFVKRRHPDLRQPDVVRAQHSLVEHLREREFPAPAIVPTLRGETLLHLEGELFEVQEYVDGAPYDRERAAHFREAALTLGRFHRCVRGFAPRALRRPDPLYAPKLLRARLDDLIAAWKLDRGASFERVVRRLRAHSADLAARFAAHGALPRLVIHGDYYAGNLLFQGDCVVGVVDYDKARWQPRVVELAEALIYFASPRPGHLEHLVYPGFLQWEPFSRFLRRYAAAITLDEREARALPDYVRCIWLEVSLQRLLEQGPRPPEAQEALREALALGDWAEANAGRMIEIACTIAKERK